MNNIYNIEKQIKENITSLIEEAKNYGLKKNIDETRLKIYLIRGIFILFDNDQMDFTPERGLQIGKYYESDSNNNHYHCVTFFIPTKVNTLMMFDLKSLEEHIQTHVKTYIKSILSL